MRSFRLYFHSSKIAFTVVFAWLCGVSCAFADFSGTPITFQVDGGWCWFQDPRAIIINGHLIIGTVAGTTVSGVSTGGDEKTTDYNFSNGVLTNVTLKAAYNQDDHASPAFAVLPDGRVLVVYESHGGSNYVLWRVSSNVGDGTTWGAEQTSTVNIVGDGNGNTYNNPYYLSIDNAVHNTSRAIGYDPNHTRFIGLNSTDNSSMTSGSNFAYYGHVIYWKNPGTGTLTGGNGRPYVKYASDGVDKIWFATTEDSPQNYVNSLYVGYMQFNSVSAGTMYLSTGTAVGTMSTGTAPSGSSNPPTIGNQGPIASGSGYSYLPTQFTPITLANTNYNGLDLSGSSAYGAGYTPWASTMRLDASGKPYFGFVIMRSLTGSYGSNLEYGYAHLVGNSWIVKRIAYAGLPLQSDKSQNQYAGLIAVDPLDYNKVYISANVDPATGAALSGPDGKQHCQIFAGVTADNGTTWTWTQLTNTSTDNVRPIIAAGSGKEALLWMQGTYTTYTNYNTNVVGLVQFTSPAITSALNATTNYGAAFNYQITANNNPASYAASGLSYELGLNTTTGLISGTTTVAGTSSIGLSAIGTSGTVSATLTLTVLPPTVTISSPASNVVTVTGLNTKLHLVAGVSVGMPTLQWSMVSGSGTVTFSSANSADTTAQFSQSGTYVLRVTATYGTQAVSADMTVYVNPTTDSALALWLKLDEPGGTVAADSSAIGNTGTASAGVVWQSTGGKIGGAAQLGNNSVITVPDSSTLDNTSAFTLSYWFKANSIVDGGGLVSKRNGLSDNNAYCTFLKTGGLLNVDINVNNDGSSYDRFTSNTVFTTGTWYHVAVVFDGSKVAAQRASLYVNGALDKTATETSATVQDSNAPFRVGTLNSNAAYFDGLIDDVRFYRRALSATEIAVLVSGTVFVPSVSCGSAPSATSGVAVLLTGTVSDNGGGTSTVTWTKVSGTGAVTFDNVQSASTNVTFSQAGSYVLRLSASNSVSETRDELTVNVSANQNVYADWINSAYPNVTDQNIIGPQADPDHDGVSNLFEFALGMDPAKSDAASWTNGQAGLPVQSWLTAGGADYLSLQVRRPIGRNGVTYLVKVSSDLVNWADAVQAGTPTPKGDGSETVIFRDTTPRNQAPKRFIRLKVTQP